MSLIESACKLQAMGPKNVIIKKGEHGAILFSDKKIFQVPAFPLKNFDPTGAGDSFIGGFAGVYLKKTTFFSSNENSCCGCQLLLRILYNNLALKN